MSKLVRSITARIRRAPFGWSILFAALLLQPGCKSKELASRNQEKPGANASANANAPGNSNSSTENNNSSSATKTDGVPADAQANPTPQLLGRYELREIEDKGVITLVSQMKTELNFSAEGTYSRLSQRAGRAYHSDSGKFRVEKPDKLVLMIQVSVERKNPKIHTPPLQRVHTLSLSPDGDELRLTSDKGTTAVFRRVSKPTS